MINMIMSLGLGGLVNLVVSSVVFYYVFAFFALIFIGIVSAIWERDWLELRQAIGWLFFAAYGILFAMSILGILVGFVFQSDFAQNGVQFSSIVIFCIICFIASIPSYKIGDYLVYKEEHEREKEWGTEKERAKLIQIIGYNNWIDYVSKNREERIELLKKLRNKEKIIYIHPELR